MVLNIKNETSALKAVVLGQPQSMGRKPGVNDVYDAKSYETVQDGHYPEEKDIIREMDAFEKVLLKYGVKVFRPDIILDCNQVFARDVAFVIEDKIIISNIIPNRVDEQDAYASIFNSVTFNKIYNLPEKVHIEGGDVIMYNNVILVGVYAGMDYSYFKTARTNIYAVDFLKELFPHKSILSFELIKDDTNPYKGILHLDCTFMPVGKNKAIIYENGFKDPKDCEYLIDIFGKENIFKITQEEMYLMNTNIFSISPEVVVTEENFNRLNYFLEDEWGMTVEKISYTEISKMGGLLRCSTLPLVREYV